MSSHRVLSAALSAAAVVILAGLAHAAEPKVLGSFKDWNAFSYEDGGHKVCYMSSQPKKKDPAAIKRGDTYVLVTHRPTEKTFDVVSFAAGYAFKKGAEASVEVNGKTFALFTDGETAWARDSDTDKALVAILRDPKTKTMVFKGISQRGTKTTDTYSTSGIDQAYEGIGQACAVKR
jgi:hypothetical protein